MDKINALLICIICVLVGINVYVIVYTCFGFGSESCAAGEADVNYGCIAMNDNGQAVNGSSDNIWFRARIVDSESVRNGGDSKQNIRNVSSKNNEDGWVYLDNAVSPGSMSETILPYLQTTESIISDSEKKCSDWGFNELTPSEGILLEGICMSWVSKDIKSAEDAFAACRIQPLRHYKSSFI